MFPFDDMDSVFNEMMPSRLMKGLPGFMPAVDIYETKSDVIVEMSVPHIDADKVDLSIENNLLHMKGSTEKKSEVDDKNYYRREIRTGSFYRTIALPTDVLGEKASAVHENGVLRVTIPKANPKETAPVKIKVEKKTNHNHKK